MFFWTLTPSGLLWADARLQWGHGNEAVEEIALRIGSRCVTTGFNGATAIKPWKSDPRAWALPLR